MAIYNHITYLVHKKSDSPFWYVRFRIPGGIRVQRSMKTADRKEAEARAIETINSFMNGKCITHRTPNKAMENWIQRFAFKNRESPFDAIHDSPKTIPLSCYEGHGIVYALMRWDGAVKIGKSNKPRSRVSAIEHVSGIKLKSIYISIECTNYASIEKNMHTQLGKSRLNYGEWFKVDMRDAVELIQKQRFTAVPQKERIKRSAETASRLAKMLG